MRFSLDAFSPCLGTGVMSILAASHFVYHREIPLGTTYSIEVRMGGWGEKWFYLVVEYIIYPKKRSKTQSVYSDKGIAALASEPLGTRKSDSYPATRKLRTPNTLEEVKKAAGRGGRTREVGGVVCCVAVMEQCFKIGRITVPPRVAFFLATLSPDQDQQTRARDIILKSGDRGSRWLKEGWKAEPDAATIGRDIGLGSRNTADLPKLGPYEGASWIIRARESMEQVKESLRVFTE